MPEKKAQKISLPSTITVKYFSELLNLSISDVITELMKNGILATINETIDFETASIIAQDLGYDVAEEISETGEKMTLKKLDEILAQEKKTGENLKNRPPVVTILGHVDHGKTTLLDTIRKSNIATQESGGITQHINAYQVKKKGQLITFVDTPGHEAFSAMRERGVNLADIAILVVAADDGVRPQTKEVIQYLLAKKIPTIVAINKIDKPQANTERVKQELAENDILLEGWGGQVLFSKISAKQNIGIDDLLDNILLISELENFKANYSRDPLGIVLESHLDPQKGPVSAILIKTGTLKVGQDIVAGTIQGRVKRIEDFRGERIYQAGPSTPVNVIGLHGTPDVNNILQVLKQENKIKSHNYNLDSSSEPEAFNSQKIMKTIANEKIKKFNIILKADVQGSLEAIKQILNEIKSEEVAIDYISTGVGNITESDVRLANSSEATIYSFNTQTTPVAKRLAQNSQVTIKNYKIIYELIDDIKKELIAILPPIIERIDYGKLKILAIFKNGKKDMIVGGKINSGKMVNKSLVEVTRKDTIIGHGTLNNLQENKVNVDECISGKECGITFLGNTKIKVGDILISYQEQTQKRTL